MLTAAMVFRGSHTRRSDGLDHAVEDVVGGKEVRRMNVLDIRFDFI